MLEPVEHMDDEAADLLGVLEEVRGSLKRGSWLLQSRDLLKNLEDILLLARHLHGLVGVYGAFLEEHGVVPGLQVLEYVLPDTVVDVAEGKEQSVGIDQIYAVPVLVGGLS